LYLGVVDLGLIGTIGTKEEKKENKSKYRLLLRGQDAFTSNQLGHLFFQFSHPTLPT
jgi:hypothetical protein